MDYKIGELVGAAVAIVAGGVWTPGLFPFRWCEIEGHFRDSSDVNDGQSTIDDRRSTSDTNLRSSSR